MDPFSLGGHRPYLMDTSDLLTRAQGGNSEACNNLFDRYRKYLEAFLGGRLPRKARSLMETQDLVQEVYIRALPNLNHFVYRGIGSFWAYLRKIALHYIFEVWRSYSNGSKEMPLPEESWLSPAAGDAPPLIGLLEKEQFESYERAVDKLAERKRYAFLMRIELGLDYSTIAKECDYTSADAARMDVRRTIEWLVKEMTDHAA